MRTSIPPADPPADTHVIPEDWRHRAACRDEDPELFFPLGEARPGRPANDSASALRTAEATAVCRRCPVASACLTWAIESGTDFGVFGGLTSDERRALKRRDQRSRREAS